MESSFEDIVAGKADPMAVHSSREMYFRVLLDDPSGLKNETYDWKEENKFVAWVLPFAMGGTIALMLAQYFQWAIPGLGTMPPVSPYLYGAFFLWIGFELLGKFIFSIMILKYRIKINYVRKLALRPWRKLKTYVIPLILTGILGLAESSSGAISAVLLFFFLDIQKTIFTEWNPIRRRSKFLRQAFVSWDRLEDRPYTMRYDILEDILRFAVYLPFIVIFGKGALLVMIPNLINEFGDGLAEPVGIRFGKHKYRTRSLYYKGKIWAGNFERSLEGSAMVFIVSIIVVLMYAAAFTQPQLIALLIALPILMTLAEAVSPHTNDGPMLALVGCSTLWLVTHYL